MNALTGAAIGIAAIGACYGIAWVVAKLTEPPPDDGALDAAHGDVIEVPKVSHLGTHRPIV